MTFYEALKALNEGKKIRKKWWYAGDYIWLDKDNILKDKNGSKTYSSLRFDFKTNNEWEIYEEPILDDVEKEYLGNILRPFRHRVKYIKKLEAYCGRNDRVENIFIRLCVKDGHEDFFSLPYFPKGSMYKGMKTEKQYTLKELGL